MVQNRLTCVLIVGMVEVVVIVIGVYIPLKSQNIIFIDVKNNPIYGNVMYIN